MPIESKVEDLGGPKTMRQQLKVSLINFPNQEGARLDCLITVPLMAMYSSQVYLKWIGCEGHNCGIMN